MNTAYTNIKDIKSLKEVLNFIKTQSNDITVWLDWDDNIIDATNDKVIEPRITKQLFKYLTDNRIWYGIITGRFSDIICKPEPYLDEIKDNLEKTIFPILDKLGVKTSRFGQNDFEIISDENGKCIGILYMGVFFSGDKGLTIRNFLKDTKFENSTKIFVDDYDPYLFEVTSTIPDIVAFRRKF